VLLGRELDPILVDGAGPIGLGDVPRLAGDQRPGADLLAIVLTAARESRNRKSGCER
jgi:hypothetical protein